MRAIIETVFDIFYLVTVLTLGIRMIRGSKAGTQFRLFGLMAVVLGAGDSFHLVPRALALCTTGLENYAVPLGLGKWITSVTMTVFYVLLYYVWRKRYQIEGQKDLKEAGELQSVVVPVDEAARHLPELRLFNLSEKQRTLISNGASVECGQAEPGTVYRLYLENEFMGLALRDDSGLHITVWFGKEK